MDIIISLISKQLNISERQIRRGRILPRDQIRYDDPQPAVPGKMGYQDRTGVFRTSGLSVHTG